MSEAERFGRRIGHLLSESAAATSDPTVLARLAGARRAAVAARRRGPFDVLPHRVDLALFGRALRPVLSAALVLSMFVAGDYFNRQHTLAERSEVETALLADDLPIDAYLDQGFRAWLQDESRS